MKVFWHKQITGITHKLLLSSCTASTNMYMHIMKILWYKQKTSITNKLLLPSCIPQYYISIMKALCRSAQDNIMSLSNTFLSKVCDSSSSWNIHLSHSYHHWMCSPFRWIPVIIYSADAIHCLPCRWKIRQTDIWQDVLSFDWQ